jgi:hypothetical protein
MTPALAAMTMNDWHLDYTYDFAVVEHPFF